eukprot:1159771-Pelagomonas_calceolata.AAC.1
MMYVLLAMPVIPQRYFSATAWTSGIRSTQLFPIPITMLVHSRVLSPALPQVRQPALTTPPCATRRRWGRYGKVAPPFPLRASKEEAPQQGLATQQQNQPELECTLSGMDNVECDYVDPEANPDRKPSASGVQREQQSAPDLVQVAGPFGLLVLVSPFCFWVRAGQLVGHEELMQTPTHPEVGDQNGWVNAGYEGGYGDIDAWTQGVIDAGCEGGGCDRHRMRPPPTPCIQAQNHKYARTH